MSTSKMPRKGGSMSIRVEDDIREWLEVLKDVTESQSLSDTIRKTIKKSYPNIEEIVDQYQEMDQKRRDALGGMIDEGGEKTE